MRSAKSHSKLGKLNPQYGNKGPGNHRYGKHLSKEERQRISEGLRRTWQLKNKGKGKAKEGGGKPAKSKQLNVGRRPKLPEHRRNIISQGMIRYWQEKIKERDNDENNNSSDKVRSQRKPKA